tara:strand:+ start:421 stop:1986 length:1566 start_codon:yes stop_codon:yes gene_type:complete
MDGIEYLKKQVSIIVNLHNSKKYDEVIRKAKVLIKKYSNQIIFYNILSLALSAKNKNDESINYLNKAINLDPNNISVLNNLGLIYSKINNFEKSKYYLDEALKRNPNFFDALINYGNLMLSINKVEKAFVAYTNAFKIAKDNPHKEVALMALASANQQKGNFVKSEEIYKEILKFNPNNTKADKALTVINNYKDSNDEHLKEMEKKVSILKKDDELKPLYFALGKAYEDIGENDKSFKFISRGNEIEKKQIGYNIKDDEKNFKDIYNFFEKNKLGKINSPKKKIIFVVGMPRSGTTLTEQIISSHSKVHGAGELSFLSEFFMDKIKDVNFFEKLKEEDFYQLCLRNCQKHYFEKLNSLEIEEEYILDKAPLNFKWIGFIMNAFPNSKVIHCVRDPMAVCWSNFKNSFSSKSIGFSYDLNDLGKYYNLYNDLTNLWGELYKDSIYNLDYKKLVSNKDEEIKRIIEFCNLNWEDNCLFPEKNEKSVSTASLSQVRSPIYKTSIKNWERFSDKLVVLEKILKRN